ncbi:MAG: response regulator transcription factor [Treponema sp.]|nr:response regulator transcription factor [Treponema sp.]
MSKILLLEDDLSLIDGLFYSLHKQGFEVDISRTLKEALRYWSDGHYDLLILDVSLPDGSGFNFCKKVRTASNVPIIFLTASDEEVNIIMGLDIGGDDYITKPFKLGILISRINALLRRTHDSGAADTQITSNGITLHRLRGEARKNGAVLELTAAEYKLLSLFMQNPGIVLSKESILEKLWDRNESYVDDNTLAVYIHRLRMKIERNSASPEILVTVRNLGYKWNVIDDGDVV